MFFVYSKLIESEANRFLVMLEYYAIALAV